MNDSNDESNNKGLLIVFPILLLILLAVGYVRLPAVRNFVDAKAPWFREKAGHYLLKTVPGGDEQAASPTGDGASPPAPEWAGGPKGFDIAIFSAHPESWPKTLTIKKPTEFPAVVNNKKVGTVTAPAGSQVHLMKIENGKLGVEFQGGGVWIAPEGTDLAQRLQANLAAHQ